jgi:hypothetical protein
MFNWNRFMLWNPEGPLDKAVLRLTAEKMGLEHWERQPFTFDGAFLGKSFRLVGNTPVPIIAVFEHENDIRGFEQEVLKLACMRCPLKIGLTYSKPESRSKSEAQILDWVRDTLREVGERVAEDLRSEYVYLLGVDRLPFGADWYHLTFDAASGPGAFQALDG